MLLRAWLRVIRVRFLLSSAVAVFVGLSLHWWQSGTLDVAHALVTAAGVVLLHASVDLLNDYWDFRRGIDTATKRTQMSGGTGVLPEGLLDPGSVYRAGVVSLAAGAAIGCYFVVASGWPVAVLLGFAVVAIYFYSTRIVDSGMAEVFVAIKGSMIVLGTYFIQSGAVTPEAGLAGAAVGILSALVLFVVSFPDHDADKARGRRTLVILAGKRRAASCFWAFPAAAYSAVLAGVLSGLFPVASLAALAAAPLAVRAGLGLRRNYDRTDGLVPSMAGTVWFARAAGLLLAAGLVAGSRPAG